MGSGHVRIWLCGVLALSGAGCGAKSHDVAWVEMNVDPSQSVPDASSGEPDAGSDNPDAGGGSDDGGSDGEACRPWELSCRSGECINRSERCDRVIDCADSSDERNCEAAEVCRSNEFSCESGECIPGDYSCDGVVDCKDSSDERDCAPTDRCDESEVESQLPHYDGPILFTRAERLACQQRCGRDESCYNDLNCPGVEAFGACANTEILACSASEGGDCREAYVALSCCAEDNDCTGDSCIKRRCASEVQDLARCVSSDNRCLVRVVGLCTAT